MSQRGPLVFGWFLAAAIAIGGCEGKPTRKGPTEQAPTVSQAGSSSGTASAASSAFPEHPGSVTFVDEGADERTVVSADRLDDKQKFFYVYNQLGKKVRRIPIVEHRIVMYNKGGEKVPQHQGCTGTTQILGPNGQVLQSLRLERNCDGAYEGP